MAEVSVSSTCGTYITCDLCGPGDPFNNIESQGGDVIPCLEVFRRLKYIKKKKTSYFGLKCLKYISKMSNAPFFFSQAFESNYIFLELSICLVSPYLFLYFVSKDK